jgi:hypothetical protein
MQPITAFTVMLTLFLFGKSVLFSQTHVSVPVDHSVYYILDQAEVRGLCSPLPAVKPYTRGKIIETINEILNAEPKRFGSLTDGEREILENAREEFSRQAAGFDPWKGMYRFDTTGKNDIRFSLDAGIALESLNSAAYYIEEEEPQPSVKREGSPLDKDIGTDTWGTIIIRGDIGEHFSYNIDFSAGLMKAKRVKIGEYYPYASQADDIADSSIINKPVEIYSRPLAFFPYTYKKNWDGFMFNIAGSMDAGSMEGWPINLSIAARMESEMSASLFDDMLLIRFGRIRREWGAMAPGSSLVFNSAARPFVGIEANFNPVPWFSFSSLTGVLEFDNLNGISEPAMTFQNAYSIQQVELNYKNYFHIDFGSTAVWSKRFELGYIFPLLDNFFYQNYIGDFDNMAIHLNLKGQYPGLGKIWFSFFLDELEIETMSSAFDLDRHMFAYQAGIQGIIPFLCFTSLTVSYTKIEPYNYTHRRNFLPWYDRENGPMQLAYVNNGSSLGYYTPPNSDEIKVRFDTRPLPGTLCHLQYQLVRHGADYGKHQVDGSSLISELDPRGRDGSKASLRKNFLNDGAYQWMHIIKIGAEHKLKKLPLTFFGEAGAVYSYFTDISDDEYEKYAPGFQSRPAALGDYLTSTSFILTLGFKIFK